MLFNSEEFLFFFLIITPLYFIFPHRYRWAMLLGASCFFYMSFIPVYILILLFTIIIDYFAGIFIESALGRKRRFFLIISILSNLLILFFFKYFNFVSSNITILFALFNISNPMPILTVILPIGLSFHTFQAMSYTIEVYRGKQKVEKHFGIYALYVMFYPQLVAGPIERPQNMLHQFYEEHRFDYERIVEGLKLMTWGFFKKLVIADRLAPLVDQVYSKPTDFNGISLIIATIFFAFQIYCDFSGYSDIALGAARVMGFNLMQNFDRPYLSTSVTEFWRRWHISLTTWFKDYVYIPLGGNRVAVPRRYFNLFMVFLISGLWHGAQWNFVIWGAINGLYLVIGAATKDIRKSFASNIGLKTVPSLYKLLQVVTTFALVGFSWIFFRAKSLSDAWIVVCRIFGGIVGSYDSLFLFNGIKNIDFLVAVVGIIFLIFIETIQKDKLFLLDLGERSFAMRWLVYYALIVSIIVFGVYSNAKFIYFQF